MAKLKDRKSAKAPEAEPTVLEPEAPPPAPVWVRYLGEAGAMRIADRTPEQGAVFQVHACQLPGLLAIGREGPEEKHTPIFEEAPQPLDAEACCLDCAHAGTRCALKEEE